MKEGFYRAFEDRFRGSREEIKHRLRVYVPFVEALRPHCPVAAAVDLGCGRGEWLEILHEAGLDAIGVDLDEAMLAASREHGLTVTARDAVEFLGALDDSGQLLVSGFHIAEHLPFADLQRLVEGAFRVLHPGGLLILETPNPENLTVGASSFYLDPTHQRPLPPGLLGFLAEYSGFSRVRVLRLQESAELARDDAPDLLSVLTGASPDYAVVAQKAGARAILDAVEPLFEREYGLSLEALARRYQMRADARHLEAVSAAERAELVATRALARADEAAARVASAELRASEAESRTAALLNSSSWRCTAPLRLVGSAARRLRHGTLKGVARRVLPRARQYVRQHPRLKRAALRVLRAFPTLESRLISAAAWVATPPSGATVPVVLADLPRAAREFHADLIATTEAQRKGSG